jgi:hypothetical protein
LDCKIEGLAAEEEDVGRSRRWSIKGLPNLAGSQLPQHCVKVSPVIPTSLVSAEALVPSAVILRKSSDGSIIDVGAVSGERC